MSPRGPISRERTEAQRPSSECRQAERTRSLMAVAQAVSQPSPRGGTGRTSPVPSAAELLGDARARILRTGPDALSDAELLALCLHSSARGKPAFALARGLIEAFGDLRGVLNAPSGRLARAGLGNGRIGQLRAILGVARRHAEQAIVDRPLLTDTAAVRVFLQQQLAGCEREVFACLFLDTRHHLIGFERLFYGSVDRASVHPREVLKAALHCNAAAVVLAHNHPSGSAEPSPTDVRLTEELRALLAQIDVRVLDHIIVGHGATASLAERGYC
jgi:DNA repair protein RadC